MRSRRIKIRGCTARGHGRPSVAAALRRGLSDAGWCVRSPGVGLMAQGVSGCRSVALYSAGDPPGGGGGGGWVGLGWRPGAGAGPRVWASFPAPPRG